jgi:ABC-type sugar transport system substrate-binding protein
VVTIPDAAVLSGPVKQAVSAGIPVVVMNVGVSVYQDVGALTFVVIKDTAQESPRQCALMALLQGALGAKVSVAGGEQRLAGASQRRSEAVLQD